MKTTSHWTAPDHEDRITWKPATQGRHTGSMIPRQDSQADITQERSYWLEHWGLEQSLCLTTVRLDFAQIVKLVFAHVAVNKDCTK